jgi:NAD(P)-dependent dehydrogenase (short-subunit alcohol dehydrogenase family)
VALVTGASRGIGAQIARLLAEREVTVVVNYRDKVRRAEEVVEGIASCGGSALALQADLTDESAVDAMFQTLGKRLGRLDYLVLNASGGLERGKDADYAMQLNLVAQSRAVDLALPLMVADSRIVFVTSHYAHFYGSRPVFAGYEPVAAGKKAGEDALRARVPELSARGVSLVVVSGDLIEGTITPKLLDRVRPGLIEARRAQAGTLPTVEEFAREIVAATVNPALSTGETVFVGSTEW